MEERTVRIFCRCYYDVTLPFEPDVEEEEIIQYIKDNISDLPVTELEFFEDDLEGITVLY